MGRTVRRGRRAAARQASSSGLPIRWARTVTPSSGSGGSARSSSIVSRPPATTARTSSRVPSAKVSRTSNHRESGAAPPVDGAVSGAPPHSRAGSAETVPCPWISQMAG
ncbi:hypothetical protein I3J15_26515 [Streptomyces clavuligerus]|nr:hypothetical protein I3J15_26515 [Streptomyces clavuligerus]